MSRQRNSEMSMRQRFRYAISETKTSHTKISNKQKKLRWMKQSYVTLSLQQGSNNYVHILLEIYEGDRVSRSYDLTKDNLCGLETGTIIAPLTFGSCVSGRPDSGPYLLLIFQQENVSIMILLLQPGAEDQLIMQWKYFVQSNLGFAKSWPNLDIEYTNQNRKHVAIKATVMLGKTWIAFFKYIKDSLPCFWKRFSIKDISKLHMEVTGTYINQQDKDHCLIHMKDEIFTISSGRCRDMFDCIELYRLQPLPERPKSIFIDVQPPPLRPKSLSLQSTISHESTPSHFTTSSNSSEKMIPIFIAKNFHSVIQSHITRQSHRTCDESVIMDEYLTFGQVSVEDDVKQVSNGGHKIPQDSNQDTNDMPPLPPPCKSLRKTLLDLGYIDHVYLPMYKAAELPMMPYPIPNPNHCYKGNIADLKMEYLTITPPKTIDSEVNYNLQIYPSIEDPTYGKAGLAVESTPPEMRFSFDFSTDSFAGYVQNSFSPELEPIISLPETSGQSMTDMSVNTEDSFLRDKYKSQAIKSHEGILPKTVTNAMTLAPPCGCKIPKRKPMLYRSVSTSVLTDKPQTTEHKNNAATKKLAEVLKGNATISKQMSETINLTPLYSLYSSVYSHIPSSSDEEIEDHQKGDDNFYDLHMLTFPINNLDDAEKKEIFYWMKKFIKEYKNKDNVQEYRTQNHEENPLEKKVAQPCINSHGVRMRRSMSTCQMTGGRDVRRDRTSSMIYGYWSASSIIRTLDKVLRNKPPLPDTLGLSKPTRKEICWRLYTPEFDKTKHDWQALASEIGLTVESVQLIEIYLVNHPMKHTAAEIVLKHWQFMYNKYWTNGTEDRIRCPHPCTKESLWYILKEKLERNDLLDIWKNDINPENNDHPASRFLSRGHLNSINEDLNIQELPTFPIPLQVSEHIPTHNGLLIDHVAQTPTNVPEDRTIHQLNVNCMSNTNETNTHMTGVKPKILPKPKLKIHHRESYHRSADGNISAVPMHHIEDQNFQHHNATLDQHVQHVNVNSVLNDQSRETHKSNYTYESRLNEADFSNDDNNVFETSYPCSSQICVIPDHEISPLNNTIVKQNETKDLRFLQCRENWNGNPSNHTYVNKQIIHKNSTDTYPVLLNDLNRKLSETDKHRKNIVENQRVIHNLPIISSIRTKSGVGNTLVHSQILRAPSENSKSDNNSLPRGTTSTLKTTYSLSSPLDQEKIKTLDSGCKLGVGERHTYVNSENRISYV